MRFAEDDDEEIPLVESDEDDRPKTKVFTPSTKKLKNKDADDHKPRIKSPKKSPIKEEKPTKAKPKAKKTEANPDRTWNDLQNEKAEDIESGPFSEDELLALQDSIIEYCQMNNLTEEQLVELLTTSSGDKYKKAWVEISAVLPNRKVQSCHAVCKRKFNPNNYRGRWAEEEVDFLIDYVETKGREWEAIGKLLGRTSLNVRDKFKELGEGNYNKRVKEK